jgi:hypothetical protein
MPTLRVLLPLLLIGLFLTADSADARRRWRRWRRHKKQTPAAKIYAKGKAMFKAKDYVGALDAFERSYQLKPHFLIQCNIARCLERLGKMVESAERYRKCLLEGAKKSRQARKIKAALKQVEARITWVEVSSPGKGGTVYVDGKEMGPTGMPVSVNPGEAVIEVRRPGATPARTTIKARGGKKITLTLVPKEIVREVTPPPATQPVVKKPEAREPERRGISQAWFWTGAAVTVALAVTYIVTGVQALGLKSDFEEDPTRDGYNAAIDRRTLSNVFFGLAAAAAGTTTVLFFFTDFGGGEKARDTGTDDEEVALGLGLRGTF